MNEIGMKETFDFVARMFEDELVKDGTVSQVLRLMSSGEPLDSMQTEMLRATLDYFRGFFLDSAVDWTSGDFEERGYFIQVMAEAVHRLALFVDGDSDPLGLSHTPDNDGY